MNGGRIVVVGDLMVDIAAAAHGPVLRGSDAPATIRFRGGGSAANVAAWLAHDGVPVTLVTRVGDDPAGRADTTALRTLGVDVRAVVDPDAATGTCVTVIEPGGERTFLPDRAANRALAAEDLPDDVFVADNHLHLSGYVLLDAAAPCRHAGQAALRRAKAAGMTTSVDPASSGPLHALGVDTFVDWVAGVTTLMPNLTELVTLTGETDPDRAAQQLRTRAWADEVVVTLGAEGALARDGGGTTRVAASPVPSGGDVVDTTGAGDAFAAAWLAARRGGADAQTALRTACERGAQVVGRPGARP